MSFKLQFRNGVESPIFGNSDFKPNKSFTVPVGKKITKVSFYRGFDSDYLGLFELFDQNDSLFKTIGRNKGDLWGTIDLKPNQFWVGGKARNSDCFQPMILTLKY